MLPPQLICHPGTWCTPHLSFCLLAIHTARPPQDSCGRVRLVHYRLSGMQVPPPRQDMETCAGDWLHSLTRCVLGVHARSNGWICTTCHFPTLPRHMGRNYTLVKYHSLWVRSICMVGCLQRVVLHVLFLLTARKSAWPCLSTIRMWTGFLLFLLAR